MEVFFFFFRFYKWIFYIATISKKKWRTRLINEPGWDFGMDYIHTEFDKMADEIVSELGWDFGKDYINNTFQSRWLINIVFR